MISFNLNKFRNQVLKNHEGLPEQESSPTTSYSQESANVCEVPQSPVSYREATTGPDKRKWETAMETEMTSLRENHVWDLVKLPAGKRTVGSRWVCADTKSGWLHKVSLIDNSMEQTSMRRSAQ